MGSEERVEALNRILERLRVTEREVLALIEKESVTKEEAVQRVDTKTQLFPGENIAVGNLVKVKNPSRSQQRKGRVVGRAIVSSGFLHLVATILEEF